MKKLLHHLSLRLLSPLLVVGACTAPAMGQGRRVIAGPEPPVAIRRVPPQVPHWVITRSRPNATGPQRQPNQGVPMASPNAPGMGNRGAMPGGMRGSPFGPGFARPNMGSMPMMNAPGMGRSLQLAGGMNRYGMGAPTMGGGAYGGGFGGARGYMQQGGYAGMGDQAGSQDYAAESQPSPEIMALSTVLTATGVPNDYGQLRWPVGLRSLAAPETDELRGQIDALVQVAAVQAADGQANAQLADELGRAVRKFRRVLLKNKAERFGMPLAVYNESERFLNKLERAEQILKGGLAGAGGEARLKTNAPGAYDASAKEQKDGPAEKVEPPKE